MTDLSGQSAPVWFLPPEELSRSFPGWNPSNHVDKIHGQSRSMDAIIYGGLRKRLTPVLPQAAYISDKHLTYLCVELLRNPSKYGLDLHSMLVDIFKTSILDGLDKNLTCISCYRECVEGHFVIQYKAQDKVRVTRCGHQKYTNTNAINAFVAHLEKEQPFQKIDDFETLKNQIKEEYEKVKNHYFSRNAGQEKSEKWNVGDLFFYDLALRLAWHHPDRASHMPERVHLYRGPLFGAWCLWSIKKILFDYEGRDKDEAVVKQWEGLDEMPEYGSVDVSVLPPSLRVLEPYQAENYLCDFYHFYHRLEEILRRENGLVSRDKRKSPKKSFKSRGK